MKHLLKSAVLIIGSTLCIPACEKEVSICGPGKINLPPNTNAGEDQHIQLPVNEAYLDGYRSSDPDGRIVSYLWSKKDGPSSYFIVTNNVGQTRVLNLVQGEYTFELKTQDECGLYTTDEVRIIVETAKSAAGLVPVGSLSQSRHHILMAAAGNKILFIGGRYLINNAYYDSTEMAWWNVDYESSQVDIYDTSSRTWSSRELTGSHYHSWCNSVSLGTKIYLTEGYFNSGRIDVFDANSGTWSILELPEPRSGMAVLTLGNKIYFAGGGGPDSLTHDRIYVYDDALNSWSFLNHPESRTYQTGTSSGKKLFFVGYSITGRSTVNIYDVPSNSWTSLPLSPDRDHPAVIAAGTKVIFAGGNLGTAHNFTPVDVFDLPTLQWTTTQLPFGTGYFTGISALNKGLFFITTDRINVYDSATNSWSELELDQNWNIHTGITLGNEVFLAGSKIEGQQSNQSLQIFKLQF